MKKFLLTILSAATLITANSCSDDFLNVNHDENNAYTNQVTPKDRLPAAETLAYATLAGRMNRFGNLMMNAWAGNVYFYASPYSDEFKMQANSTFYNSIWDNLYTGVNNFQQIIDAPSADKYPQHVAIAKIMKAYYMQMIVDLYNDAPYSEAFKGINNMHPKYDKAFDIYKALGSELDEALVLCDAPTTNPTYDLNAAEDPMFGAEATPMDKWKQMARTVKLKLVVRVSKATDPAVVSWRNSEVATLSANPADYIDADVTINPGYSGGSAAQQNPFYNNFGLFEFTGAINSGFHVTLASEYMVDVLRGNNPLTAAVGVDKRIRGIFRNGGMAIVNGNPLPATSETAVTMKGFPQGGLKVDGMTDEDYASLGGTLFFNNAGPGSSQNGLVLTAAEVKFLLAEAAVEYPSLAGLGAKTSFEDGIKASFARFGQAAAANAYIAAADSVPGIGWTGTANKIQAIQYQKWVALTNINPTEAFISMNKTGYPVLPMPIGAFSSNRPNRLMYPQSEYVANTANVPNPALNDMYTVNQYSPFWMH